MIRWLNLYVKYLDAGTLHLDKLSCSFKRLTYGELCDGTCLFFWYSWDALKSQGWMTYKHVELKSGKCVPYNITLQIWEDRTSK